MSKKVVKMGIVGMSRGRHLADSIIGEPNVEFYAICDKDPVRLNFAKEHFERDYGVSGFKCFESFEEFLASDVEAVVIATDLTLHTAMVVQALDAGKHVLSEIPTINSIEDAQKLKDACNRHPDLKYMAGENCCFWHFINEWKRIYDAGYLGDIVLAEGEYLHHTYADTLCAPDHYRNSDGSLNWRIDMKAIEYLTHELGPLLYILDDRCVSVCGFAPDFEPVPYVNTKSNEMAVFKTAKGTMIRIFVGFGVHVGFDHNFTLYGSKGSLETDRGEMVVDAETFARIHDWTGNKKITLPYTTRYPGERDDGHGGCDTKMLHAFVECIVNDTKPPIDVDLGIRMAIPGIIAHQSMLQGGIPLEIPDIV